jgi:hypothetical protein
VVARPGEQLSGLREQFRGRAPREIDVGIESEVTLPSGRRDEGDGHAQDREDAAHDADARPDVTRQKRRQARQLPLKDTIRVR